MTLCVAFAVITLVLARQNAQLRSRLEAGASEALVRGPLRVGDEVGRVTVLLGAGDKRYVEIPESGYAAFFVHVRDCDACVAAAEGWKAVVPRLGARVAPFTLSLDAPGRIEFRERQTYGAEIYGLIEADRSPLARVPVAPTVVLVDSRGFVEAMWVGVGDPAVGAEAWTKLLEYERGGPESRPAADLD